MTSTLVRDRPALRQVIDVRTPSGQHYRWAEDETGKAPERTPGAVSFSSTAPGGFDSFSCTLPRDPVRDYQDLERLSTITVYDGAGGIVWQGRLEQAPRVSGSQMAITPAAVGWQAHLEDNKSVSMVYVDRDLSAWTGISNARRANIATTDIQDWTLDTDISTGIPAISEELHGPQTAPRTPRVEVWYDAGAGNTIASIYYDYLCQNASAYFNLQLFNSDDDNTTDDSSANLVGGGVMSGTGTWTPATARRFAMLFFNIAGALTGDGINIFANWRRLTLWGDHGLAKRGTAPDDGLYASDVIEHAVSNWAPMLGIGTITDSGFVIPQLAFKEPTTVADIISTVNRYHLWDWMVWEGPTFYYYPRGSGRSWRARVGPAQLQEHGPDVARLWNGVLVRYEDVDGTTRTVGPPGATGVNATSTYLADSDPTNPATVRGINRWDLLDMSGISTQEGAIEVGRRFLVESKALDTSGQAQLVGHVEDDKGYTWPASHVRAGDTVQFVDAADSSARRVVSASYDHDSRTTSVDLDAPPDALAALLDRLQVVLVPLGL